MLSDCEREALTRWARRATTGHALALRCRIVLAAAGALNREIARERGCNAVTVGKWRHGSPPSVSRSGGRAAVVERVIVTTLEESPPDGATQWSTRSMAAKVGLNQDRDLAGVRATWAEDRP
jgi:hypothetical protein